jgi:hypothetical protein
MKQKEMITTITFNQVNKQDFKMESIKSLYGITRDIIINSNTLFYEQSY